MNPKPAFRRLPAEKQQDLLNTAMELYATYPYEQVTARLLCTNMGINPATFYRYFDSKDSLMLYLVDVIQQRYLAYHMDQLERLGDHESSYFPPFSLEQPDYCTDLENRFLIACNKFPMEVIHDIMFRLSSGNETYYRAVLERERAAGRLREDVDIDLIAYMYATTGYNLMAYCMKHGLNQQEYVDRKLYFFYDFFYHGILTGEGGKEQ
ncbi:TetR/AcrR family transcriptional regulator [Pseudoflavonifractor intestinihominis]|uniref:TetR/AcrR family transcriptional regulator n=1 Tax=Pseudoflavonifractor intestinihominis TaxID=3133171 RepID=A0ABV1EBE9_9FIRM|nr:TetR/AcrR family transcriptional regulator [uncultured Pseudoflavonifractor sp.]